MSDIIEQAKEVDLGMLELLEGKVLYIHEGGTSFPYSGTLDQFGETLLRFTDVTIYIAHFDLSRLADMRRALRDRRCFGASIPALYKNRNDIATLVELYPGE